MVTKLAPRIVADPQVRFGKPVIEGTRVDVETVVRSLAAGWTIDDVMREYSLQRDDVIAALEFAAALAAEKPNPAA